jgi:dienelactone hydrolase
MIASQALSAMRRLPLLCVILGLIAPLEIGAARAQFELRPAYPAVPLKGPQAAKGAVIWNHGVNFLYGSEAAEAPLPMLTALFRDQGWDVFRLLRPRMSEEPRRSAEEVVARARQLKAEGYRRVVLAGQSGGAWLSLMAASRSDDIHAVIANAPAWYGTDRPTYLKNGFVLFDHIADIRRGRIMITYFADDPYDPGGRGAKSEELLAAQNVPHLVIDRPEGFSGHGSGNSGLFLRRFGGCLLALAGDGPVPRREDCESDWGRAPSGELKLPAKLTLAKPSGGEADPFLGKWYGYYANGREIIMAIESVSAEDIEAVYAIGGTPDGAAKPQLSHRHGRLAEGKLVFDEPGQNPQRYALRPDGALDLHWSAADGRSFLEATLHRLP